MRHNVRIPAIRWCQRRLPWRHDVDKDTGRIVPPPADQLGSFLKAEFAKLFVTRVGADDRDGLRIDGIHVDGHAGRRRRDIGQQKWHDRPTNEDQVLEERFEDACRALELLDTHDAPICPNT